MFSSEIKETIYIAIGLFLAAAVLGLVAFVMDIRGDFASAQNQEIAARNQMTTYAEFDKYEGDILYGEDVIALIREYADSDIKVYIDKVVWTNGDVQTDYWVTREEYLRDPSQYSFTTLEESKQANAAIKKGISRKATYFSYLVFDKYTTDEIKAEKYRDGNVLDYSTVVAVKVVCLDEANRRMLSEVQTQIDALKN
jgi:hypothetical protein